MLSIFSSRRNWDSPNPSPAGECAPPPPRFWGEGTLAGERGVGRVPIPTRGHTQVVLFIYTYYVIKSKEAKDHGKFLPRLYIELNGMERNYQKGKRRQYKDAEEWRGEGVEGIYTLYTVIYLEYQSVSPIVGIGSPHPLSPS